MKIVQYSWRMIITGMRCRADGEILVKLKRFDQQPKHAVGYWDTAGCHPRPNLKQ